MFSKSVRRRLDAQLPEYRDEISQVIYERHRAGNCRHTGEWELRYLPNSVWTNEYGDIEMMGDPEKCAHPKRGTGDHPCAEHWKDCPLHKKEGE